MTTVEQNVSMHTSQTIITRLLETTFTAVTSTMDQIGDFRNYTESNQPKKRKVEHDFRPGNIMKVEVTNFTTYSYAHFELSPTLNMMIGPNGTGKSTLVAAICLGLAGKIDLIKRKSLKSMIKTGNSSSTIIITLMGKDNNPLEIQRHFDEKSSNWKINGSISSEKHIKDLCKSFNIQLDNLCHFLPQERVAEFAGLSPEKLLIETERTLYLGDLLHQHEDLIDLDSLRASKIESINTYQSKLESLRESESKLEQEVERFQQYNDKSIEVENHKLLLPYAIREDEKYKRHQLREIRNEAKAHLDTFNSDTAPLTNELDENNQLSQKLQREIENRTLDLQKSDKKYDNVKREITNINNIITELQSSLTTLKTSAKRKKRELDHYSSECRELKLKLNDLPSVDEAQLDSLKESRDKKHGERLEVISEISSLDDTIRSFNNRINNLDQEMKAKMRRISSSDRIAILEPNDRSGPLQNHSFKLHTTLRSHPEFKGTYFECPIVSCNVIDRRVSGAMERAINQNNLMALTFTSNSNYENIPQGYFKANNAPIRVVTQNAPPSPIPTDRLREYGFDKYLSDFISGPKEVINMLNVNAKLNMIPVSLEPLTEQQLSKLMRPIDGSRLPFMRFIAGDDFFTISKSKYGSQQYFYNSEKLMASRFFNSPGLSEEVKLQIKSDISTIKANIEQLKQEIKTETSKLQELKKDEQVLNSEFDDIKNEINRLQKSSASKERLELVILQKEERIKKLESDTQQDNQEKIKQTKKKILEKYKLLSQTNRKVIEEVKNLSEKKIQLNMKQYMEVQYGNRATGIDMLISEVKHHREKLENEYLEAQRKYNEMKDSNISRTIKEQAENYREGQEETLANLASYYLGEQTFSEKFIREKIQLLEDERVLMSTADNNSIGNLRKIQEEIGMIDQTLPVTLNEKAKLDSRIERIQKKWEPALTKLVGKISKAFEKRFKAVASTGKVELQKSEKFSEWRLEILVKFRETADLKILDKHSQSGGERAVSTIFFIMALQGLTEAPFRIVDEINQGMDPSNEKMAHKYLVHTACQKTKSQYFLITPKLLTGLYYHPDMAVHCIYTGPYIDKNDKEVDMLDLRNQFF